MIRLENEMKINIAEKDVLSKQLEEMRIKFLQVNNQKDEHVFEENLEPKNLIELLIFQKNKNEKLKRE